MDAKPVATLNRNAAESIIGEGGGGNRDGRSPTLISVVVRAGEGEEAQMNQIDMEERSVGPDGGEEAK